jgi:multidrug efflux pump subunit AcrA (membrane-fusion protein)
LKADAGEKEIRQLDGLEMGTYRGQLLTAYAAYRAAKTIHAREAGLRDKKISSAQDLLTAETDLQQARAAFHALMDTARFETLIAYTEAIQERQTAAFNAVAAEKQLRLKGVGDEAIAALRALVPKPAGLAPCPCDDPQCNVGTLPSVSDVLGRDPRFAWYALRAPFDGTVVERHITPGEAVDTSAPVFTIADLSDVWVDLAVSQNRIGDVQAGFPVTIQHPDGANTAAEIRFVSPLVSPETRTALARVALDNTGARFRPGTFVDAAIQLSSGREAVVIPKSAIQLVNDHPCVFVWGNGAFERRDVETGATDGTRIEVLKGLQPGEKIAAVNAFHLKAEHAKTATGDLGACHGHSH